MHHCHTIPLSLEASADAPLSHYHALSLEASADAPLSHYHALSLEASVDRCTTVSLAVICVIKAAKATGSEVNVVKILTFKLVWLNYSTSSYLILTK